MSDTANEGMREVLLRGDEVVLSPDAWRQVVADRCAEQAGLGAGVCLHVRIDGETGEAVVRLATGGLTVPSGGGGGRGKPRAPSGAGRRVPA